MKNLVFFGSPGSGKGTQASLISEIFGFLHLSTGEIFRSNIKGKTDLGRQVEEYISKGLLVPDDLTISLLKDTIEQNDCSKGIIFDGFPRTIDQATSLEELLKKSNTEIHLVVGLEVDNKVLTQRLLERGKTSGRVDDADDKVIQTRIQAYENETLPVKKFYLDQNKYHAVNGVGDIQEITSEIKTLVEAI